MKPRRFGVVSVIIVLVLAAIFFVPFPSQLSCRVIVVPHALDAVYSRQNGIMTELLVQPGSTVSAHQVLARLENPQLQMSLAEKEGKLAELYKKRETAIRLGNMGPLGLRYLNEVPNLNAEIQKLQDLTDFERSQIQWLEIKAPVAGTVIATPLTSEYPGKFETPLGDRQPVLSGRHQDISIRRGERVCEIADLSSWEVIVLLTERQVKFTYPGQTTRIRLHALPGTLIETELEVVGVADRLIQRQGRNETPDNLQSKIRLPDLVSELVAQTDQDQVQYIAKAKIPNRDLPLQIGLDGQGRLRLENRSLAQRLWWWFNENFGA